MAFAHSIGNRRYTFASLSELLARGAQLGVILVEARRRRLTGVALQNPADLQNPAHFAPALSLERG
jgi:hypothetical protein